MDILLQTSYILYAVVYSKFSRGVTIVVYVGLTQINLQYTCFWC